ncbi:hypothetical protein [Chitinibacter sp. ZOR0017]|uniref:hypothetical protein n=1 Tax=Chitinibacter sp. ZOR0017 TaxID=1339254 RepID=UPI000648EA0E|nr:hypothetical protein [Chitinibacter sp. ZOR0017]
MSDYTNPKNTIYLLEKLLSYGGFTDAVFSTIHHFEQDTVRAHIRHCEQTTTFRAPNNWAVQQRLEFILKAFWGTGLQEGSEAIFLGLATAAIAHIPLPEHPANQELDNMLVV